MFKNSFIVMSINLISRIMGLIREVLIASYFGASSMTDAFFSATRISNFFTTILGEGSLGTVFIPLYHEKYEKEGKNKADNFVFSLINLITSTTITLSVIMIIFSKFILKYIIRFQDENTLSLASNILKITSCYLIFIALSGILSSLLNSYKKFIISTSTAIVFNLTIIIGMILTYNTINIYGLAISYLLSGIFQFIFQVPSFLKFVSLKNYKFNIKDEYIKKFLLLMIPTLIGIFAYQINEVIDTSFAAMLKAGTISSINYASRLYLLPIGVFSISLSVVIFPVISKAVVKKDFVLIKKTIDKGLKLISFFIIPSSIGLFFYSKKIVNLIYGNGKFSTDSVIMTSEILRTYSIGLIFFATIHLLTRAHYVHKDRKIPTISSITSILVNIILDSMLYKNYHHIGLTIATVIAAMINFFILFISLKNRYINIDIKSYLIFLIKIFVYSIISLYISMFYVSYKKISIFINICIFLIIFSLLIIIEILLTKKTIKKYFE